MLRRSGRLAPCLACPAACTRYAAQTRGLCRKHYLPLYRQVKEGRATWAELAAQGLCKLTDVERGLPSGYRFQTAAERAQGGAMLNGDQAAAGPL